MSNLSNVCIQNSAYSAPQILIGAGGHAKVLFYALKLNNVPLIAVCDPALTNSGIEIWNGLTVLREEQLIENYHPAEISLVNGVGQKVADSSRARIYDFYKNKGYFFSKVIHPSASIDTSAVLAEGVQVMAGAVIQPDVTIGENVLVNTNASIDHDCKLSAQIHIAPGAVLCGHVKIDAHAFIGAGAVLTQGITIGCHAIVGAGVSLVHDLGANQKALPAAIRILEN